MDASIIRLILVGLAVSIFQCSRPPHRNPVSKLVTLDSALSILQKKESNTRYTGILEYIPVTHDVRIKDYFVYVDSLIEAVGSQALNDYVLVHFNPWILDSLRATDYYVQRDKGTFLFDQSKKIVLHKNDSIAIPDSLMITQILQRLRSTIIDVNIPEYTLRIFQADDTLLCTKVRVGQNETKYLELAGHDVDLRTPVGSGEIIRIERNPIVINPETGKRYEGTYRDDGRFTKMPLIPWLEPQINGVRYGTLIHPTTNPVTLGYALSHGCVGTSEADAWTIYYNAPIGTPVTFRYDLVLTNPTRDTLVLKDIYQLKSVSH